MSFQIDFEWSVAEAGYDWVGVPPKSGDSKTVVDEVFLALGTARPPHIVPRGDTFRSYRPFDQVNGLFRIFAARAATPDGLLEFVRTFGPMLPDGNRPSGEDALTGLSAAQEMADLLREYSKDPRACFARFGKGLGWSRIDVHLAFNAATGRPHFRFSPPSLLHALWFEVGEFLTRDARVRECLHCGGWFEAGPGTTRRADAKFCSDEHRITFNSLKRTFKKEETRA